MSTLIDFSSLFQLGFATGIGLGLFQAPVRLRIDRLSRSIDNELVLLDGTNDAVAKNRLLKLQSLKIEVASARFRLERDQRWPLAACLVGAIIDLLLLVWAELDPSKALSGACEALFILLTIGWYLGILCWMEMLALDRVGPLLADFKSPT